MSLDEFYPGMCVIDSHVHLYPPEVSRDPAGWALANGETQWAGLVMRRRKNGSAVQTFPGVDELLREMDRSEVERAVLLGWYWSKLETCETQNRFYASCVRAHPDRLSAFATIQPLAEGEATLREVRRACDDGLIGLGELSPHAQGYATDDPVFREALALAAELRLPVTLHVTDPNSRIYPGRVETPLEDFVQLARAMPRMSFVLAHWGGLLPLRDPETAALPNLFYDTAASPLVYDDSVWGRFFSAIPSDRVLFGSDYPLNVYPKFGAGPMMARFIAEAKNAGATEDVMYGNAARLLGF